MRRINLKEDPHGVSNFLAAREQNRSIVADEVARIGEQVERRGWEAIAEFTRKFDGIGKSASPQSFQVPEQEFVAAASSIREELKQAILVSIQRVSHFHARQTREDWFLEEEGIRTGQMFRPLERVGLYAPSGKAPLFSTLIMDAIPAQVAGCPSIILCSPPQRESGGVHPLLLGVCHLLGIAREQIWTIGGPWAVFAMAYGLEGFPKTDGVFGPGNQHVMEAKKQVQGKVRIESLPGNSEILVIADETADPRFVAADLLSQAEHAGGEMAILATPSESLIDRVEEEVKDLLAAMKRREIAESSLSTGGALILVRDLEEACAIANQVAPEHLEIQTKAPEKLLERVRHAGAIFLGKWSTEPVGDYTAGTNHVLPTGGAARFSSALSVDDFIKKISIVEVDEKGLRKIGPPAMLLAEAEGLLGHKTAIESRLNRQERE